MSTGANTNSPYDSLMRALESARYPAAPNRVRVVTKRTKHSGKLAERVQKNAELADELIEVIKELNRKPGTEDQVDQLIDLAKNFLDNNAKLREQVGEALQDIPISG